MRQDLTSQSAPVTLFLQGGLANYRAAARDLVPRTASHTLSPMKSAALLSSAVGSLRSRITRHRSPAPPRRPHEGGGSDARAGTDSCVSSRPTSPPPAPHGRGPASNGAFPAPGSARLSHSASAHASLSHLHNGGAAAAADAPAGAKGAAEEQADAALFQVLVQVAKALYPGRKTWMSTAHRVATWLGLPRVAREGLHRGLRSFACSQAAAAAHLQRLLVRPPLAASGCLATYAFARR